MTQGIKLINEKMIEVLSEITIEEVVTEFLERQTSPEVFENSIVQLTDTLNSLEGVDKNELYLEKFDIVEKAIQEIKKDYPSYLSEWEDKIDMILTICNKIFSTITDDFVNESFNFDPHVTKFKEINYTVGLDNYLYTESGNTNKFIFLICFNDLRKIKEYITNIDFENTDILFHLLSNINSSIDFSKKYCLFSLLEYEDKIPVLTSFLELKNVQEGNMIHVSINYEEKPSVTSDLSYSIGNGYNQFSETIFILSEYNNETGILEKYLKIYQVIENFMYRMPICDLTNGADSSNMFSIRDFKRLYGHVDKNEPNALKDLFIKAVDLDYNSSKKFKNLIAEKYNAFNTNQNKIDLEEVLPKMGVKNPINLHPNEVAGFFSSIVYKLRNSIVHNKETEYHLSYGKFPDIIRALMTDFLLVCLEELVYNMVIKRNSLIWYDNPQIYLYN
ncbi:hypothetical protein SAMN04487975_105179 [Planococcus glaciei]|uniref:hypothetical protein n=1 Tax=Planococcus glaciei TaxID=459472 RepID=UPI000880F4B8|nr:hypothetical protein [Planococcus glaciei]SDH54406.1 hypothetical protein SAMN04487975_105179 [Planococcus glaciei]